LNKYLNRGLVAVMGSLTLAMGAAPAAAQSAPLVSTNYSINAGAVDASAAPRGNKPAAGFISAVQRTVASTSNIFSSAVGSVFGTQTTNPQQAELQKITREGRWLYNAGWPLYALIDRYSTGVALDEQANCLATAVYFEARGESLDGQLAVARVVMNRAASDQYPATWCDVVKQPWQFSFVQHGQFPAITDMDSWKTAQGVARVAMANIYPSLPQDVLWYHANYVHPSWGTRLTRVEKIGAHIFFRA
jgi:N-acetylmuramoyl-L-alanine amidase